MIAVDSSLFKEVVKIFICKESVSYNQDLLNLFKYIQPPIMIGSFQIPDKRALSQSGGIMLSVEAKDELDLARKTKLKLILSKNKSNYPYINIKNDEFESNYTATYPKKSSKTKVLEHIKCLIKEGSYIEIYDKYLLNDNGDSINVNENHHSVNVVNQIFPKELTTQKLKIFCKNTGSAKNKKYRIDQEKRIEQRKKNICNKNIEYSHENLPNHDRYIKIYKENKESHILAYEIILSSGLYNILGDSDFTYVVRVF